MSDLRGPSAARGDGSRSWSRGSTRSSPASSSRARLACLRAHGVAEDDLDVAWVPGAFELPLVARRLAALRRFDAVICLGAVIRGETAHFDSSPDEAARGIPTAARDTGVPVIFGVLTTDTLEQAMDRAGGAAREQGMGRGDGRAGDGVAAGRAAERERAAMRPMIVDKPWGKVATYALNQPRSVRVITIEPGQETSVHYHQMRDEMWVVLDPGLTRPDRQPRGRGAGRGRSSWSRPRSRIASEHGRRPRPGPRDRARLHDRGRHAAPAGRLRPAARARLVSLVDTRGERHLY